MFPALKKSLIPLAVLALVLAGATALPAPTTRAAVEDGVYFLDAYGTAGDCSAAGDPREVRLFDVPESVEVDMIDSADGVGDQDPVIQIAANDELIICVDPIGAGGPVVFNSSGNAEWTDFRCGDLGTDCTDEDGVGTDDVTVPDTNDVSLIAATYECGGPGLRTISILQDDSDGEFNFIIMCKGRAENVDISATPTTVESDPAQYNLAYSLIRVVITDAAGNPVLPGTDVDFTVDRCSISSENVDTLEERNEVLFNAGVGPGPGDITNLQDIDAEFGIPPLLNYLDIAEYAQAGDPNYASATSMDAIEVDTNAAPDDPDGGNGDGVPNHSEALAILNVLGCDPGPVTISVEVDGGGPDAEGEIVVNVVGPPAFITVVAAPTELTCGEKSEITVSATDALNQGVSDFTKIEVITNFGGVVGGNGATLLSPQPRTPVSSTQVILFDGAGTAFLLTSDKHIGSYEVLAAHRNGDDVTIVNQVTVTCTDGVAPTITPPDTGTGEIRPPNTGDAGLAAGTTGSTLLAIAGATFVALALVARTRFGHN